MMRKFDARWFVLLNNSLLLTLGVARFGLQRTPAQIAFCFGLAIPAELIAAIVTRKLRFSSLYDRILSSAVACVSTLILVRGGTWWFYGVLASIGVLSKYVITTPDRRHVFNPTNFAIVAALAFFGNQLFVRPDQFSTSYLAIEIILGFGALAVIFSGRWRLTLGYYLAVLLFGLPLGMQLGVRPLWILAPELNSSTLIFAFLMITDPRTTPADPGPQWLFGACVGALHLTMRYAQVPYSPFVALFAVTAIRSVLQQTALAASRRRALALG